MTRVHDALQGAQSASHSAARPGRRLLLAGGAGALGSAVLEQALACGTFGEVNVLVMHPLNTALRGLVPVSLDAFERGPRHSASEDTAMIVFDRIRHANGRERAFVRPEPSSLVELATLMRRHGVRTLVVVSPHAAATLPEALKRGLASLDEHAVASLGFEHLVFVRSAQAPSGLRSTRFLQRLADAVLAQLRFMIPQHERPVRATRVAQFAVQTAVQLPGAAAGTRIAAPELVWLASQVGHVGTLVDDWLQGRPVPALPRGSRRRPSDRFRDR